MTPKNYFAWIRTGCVILGVFSWISVSAISQSFNGVENYPGKLNIKNVNGLGKNISTDYFAGSMVFSYPFDFPVGSRGLTPKLALSYNSNNSDAFSPYGYGFSLSIPRIQRNAKKGTSELYNGNEYVFNGNDLILDGSGTNIYRSKDASDMSKYILSGSTWIIMTDMGGRMIYGGTSTGRIVHPDNASKIYAWLLESEEDAFGHKINYFYSQNGGQPYLSKIEYGYTFPANLPSYTIQFSYVPKSKSLSSYRTQFEISTKQLLSVVKVFANGQEVRGYILSYDTLDAPISHLMSIAETSPSLNLPKIEFLYGSGQYQHSISTINNNRGGKAYFSYAPSTGYRDGSGALMNTRLPFVSQTLSRQVLEDSITGLKSEESYSYSGGHYYYDASDIWGREYVGFSEVTITDEKTRQILSFHQSQTADKNPLKMDDDILKKGRPYLTRIYEKSSGKLLSWSYTRYLLRVVTPTRKLVYPAYQVERAFDVSNSNSFKDSAKEWTYDDYGNLTEEKQLGWVTVNTFSGTYSDIPGDEVRSQKSYIIDTTKNLYRFVKEEKILNTNGTILTRNENYYDTLALGLVNKGLLTKKRQYDVITGLYRDTNMAYDGRGNLISEQDPLGNTTTSTYDSADIALVSQTNPKLWTTSYEYDYSVGKPRSSTDQNSVKRTVIYDAFGREKEQRLLTPGFSEVTLSETNYDDVSIPNKATKIIYFLGDKSDLKTEIGFSDGWGRTIGWKTSTEIAGQYSTKYIRYDEDGNPIYLSYPYFETGDAYNAPFALGNQNGEYFRSVKPGAAYVYDVLGRISREITSAGTTEKRYTPGTESVIDALGHETKSVFDAYGRPTSLIERLPTRDITTNYTYDALGRTTKFTDALGNIREWKYDGYGRMYEASDLHALGDTSFGLRKYEYDNGNRISKYTSPNGIAVNYTYDPLSRLTTESWSGMIRNYSYDAGILGTLASVTDSGSVVNYSYDPLGRKTGEVRQIGGKSYALSYVYNIQNALTTINYPDGGKTEYSFKKGYIEGVSYTATGATKQTIISDIVYAPNATMKSVKYANGITQTTERDVNNNYRLTRSLATAADGNIFLDTNYGYDALSQITSVAENGVTPLKKTISYVYDPLDRLTNATYAYTASGYNRDQNQVFNYTYNDIGNIQTSPLGMYGYGGSIYGNPHAVTSVASTTYDYDQAGNMSSRADALNTTIFTYSPYTELLSSMKNGALTTYSYDQTRRRVSKVSEGLIEHHIIDGYEVEYESGALIYVPAALMTQTTQSAKTTLTTNTLSTANTPQSSAPLSSTGTTSSGTTSSSGVTSSGTLGGTGTSSSLSGATNTGTLSSTGGVSGTGTGTTSSGTTSSGTLSGTSTPVNTSTGATATGTSLANTGSVLPPESSPTGSIPPTASSIAYSGTTDTGTYIVIASYVTGSGSTPVEVRTSTTRIYLGDMVIATFQSQTDDTPKTPDDDKFIFHLRDHLASSSVDLSLSGVLMQATDYQPFGKTITYEVTTQRVKGVKGGYRNKYLFANKQLDEETDLEYFEKRYYDPKIGRFTTEDPVFWEVGLSKRPSQYFTDPEQWNSYSYVRNNPVNLVDPTGELEGEGTLILPTIIVVVVTAPEIITIGAAVAVGYMVYHVTSVSGNEVTLGNPTSPDVSGAGSTSGGGTIPTGLSQPLGGALTLEDIGVITFVTATSGTSGTSGDSKSSPSGGGSSPENNGDKGGKGDKGDRGKNRNPYTSKDYEKVAKEKGMKEVYEFGKSVGEKIYRLGNKYYSPEKTAHNTEMGWKVFKKVGSRLIRIGTATKDLEIFKK